MWKVLKPMLITRRGSPGRFQSVQSPRLISQCGQANTMSESFLWTVHVVIINSCMRSHTVVPESNRPFLPFHSGLEVLACRNMLKSTIIRSLNRKTDSGSIIPWKAGQGERQTPQLWAQWFSLWTLDWYTELSALLPTRSVSHCGIYQTRFETYRMYSHYRVLRLYRLPTNMFAISPGVFGLGKSAVLRFKALQQCLDGRGKAGVGRCLAGPCCIAAGFWHWQES